MKIGRFFITVIILFANYSFSLSQNADESDSTEKQFTNSLQFYIVNQLNVAYKRYICDKSSIRFTVDYYNKFNDDELVKNETFDDYTTSIINTETKTTNRYLEFKIQYLYDINLNNIVTVFVGGGFFTNNEFSSSEDNYERFTNEILENTTYYKTTTDVWRIGAGIVVGVDCTLYKNITLFAEYEGVINKGWKTWRYGYNYKSEHESNEWGYELKGIKIGVGVNF